MSDAINMHRSDIVFGGINIKVDSFDNKGDINDIMPIFYEEQPITWKLYGEEIIANRPKEIIDVGCGSGFWSLLLKNQIPESIVLGIDKNVKAIEYTKLNAVKNGLDVSLINAIFQDQKFNKKFDLVVLTPPYHIYPYKLENQIPFFARGGNDGQQEFYSQLHKAKDILAGNGTILFNMMCIGDHSHPNYVKIIRNIFRGDVFVRYTNILPPMASTIFVDNLYPQYEDCYLKEFLTETFPVIYYTSGLISRNQGFKVEQDNYRAIDQETFDWEDRIQLHKEINKFGK